MEEGNLKFIGDLDGGQDLGSFQILDILDTEMFFIAVDDEDLEQIYFWSVISFNIFVFDLKKLGVVTINGEEFDLESFPVLEIKKTHDIFEKTLSAEALERVKYNVGEFEKELIKLSIDKRNSN